jgi:anti-sigma-K factor RskA
MTQSPSSEMSGDPPVDLAAEFVLGVLSAAEWREAQQRASTDPAFAAEVTAWESRLTPMIHAGEAMTPATDLWPRIRRALPANDTGRPDGLTFWRGLTAASGFIAVVCLTLVVISSRPPEPRQIAHTPSPAPPSPPTPAGATASAEPMQVALLRPAKGPTAFVATLDRSRKVMTVSPGAAPVPRGKSLVLWMIPPGGAPQLLGVIPSDHSAKMPMPDAFEGKGDTPIVLAVSIEPTGGPPTGKPTGPMVASGRFVTV